MSSVVIGLSERFSRERESDGARRVEVVLHGAFAQLHRVGDLGDREIGVVVERQREPLLRWERLDEVRSGRRRARLPRTGGGVVAAMCSASAPGAGGNAAGCGPG